MCRSFTLAQSRILLISGYENGQGVQQDYAEAAKWFGRAAVQDVVETQTNLGVMPFTGRGLPQNYEEAVKWWLMAAAQGDG